MAVATLYEKGMPQTGISTTASNSARQASFNPSRSDPMTRAVFLWN